MNSDIKIMPPLPSFLDDAYVKKERDKARKIKSSQWWKRKRSTGICHYCKGRFPPKELTMDHVIPIARGGKSERFNVVPCCKQCNTNKRQMIPAEWEEDISAIKE